MEIQKLSDKALLEATLTLVKREKEILSDILSHLEEVRRRRLFSELGYGSLFQYCVKHLGYSEDQTYRRINALKLIKEIPQVQKQIASGTLTLSIINVAQTLFKADTNVNKVEVLASLENKSKREAEKIVRTLSPNLPPKQIQLKLNLTESQQEKWQQIKSNLAHRNLSDEELFERICDQFLVPAAAPRLLPPRSSAAEKSIPNSVKREVKARDQYRCSKCQSQHALQIDHKVPRSLGGNHNTQNLRLLCRQCNQRAAIKVLGLAKMEKYLERTPKT